MANRSAAAQIMLSIANRQEQYLLDARAYTTALNSTGLNITQDGWTYPATACTNNFYSVAVAIASGPPPTYTITATPNASTYQSADGTLTLTSAGGAGSGAVTFSVTNGTASGCAIVAGVLSATSAGTCLVTATKAASGDYLSATSSVTRSPRANDAWAEARSARARSPLRP